MRAWLVACPGRRFLAARVSPAGGSRPLRGSAQRVRDPGEVLHDPIVEVGGDAAPLVGRRLERAHEQLLPLVLAPLEPAREALGERDLHEPQQEQAARAGAPRTAARSGGPSPATDAPALVRLEEQRRAVRRADREVDLVAARPAPARIGSRARRGRLARRARLPVSSASSFESSSGYLDADQPRLVGVDDAPVAAQIFTRTTLSPSTRSWTTLSSAAIAASSPSTTPSRAPARRSPAPTARRTGARPASPRSHRSAAGRSATPRGRARPRRGRQARTGPLGDVSTWR